MRKTIHALALVLALSASAYAGEMQCPLQQPTTCSTTQSTATTVETQDSTTTTDGEMQFGVTETVLSAMGSLLAVL